MATGEKVAIVTGAAQGIGKSIAVCMLRQGYKVFLFDKDYQLGTDTQTELKGKFGENSVTFCQCDVTNDEQFKSAFSEVVLLCRNVSVMVNNAGIADEHNPHDCIQVNLTGTIRGSNLAIDHMRKDTGGLGGIIINVSSMAAVQSYHILPTYCATKSGVLNFTKSWAKHPKLQELGLKFLCLCPGFVETTMTISGGSRTLDPSVFETAKNTIGLLQLETIETAFQKLLMDEINGSVLEVSTYRTEYMTDTCLMQSNKKHE